MDLHVALRQPVARVPRYQIPADPGYRVCLNSSGSCRPKRLLIGPFTNRVINTHPPKPTPAVFPPSVLSFFPEIGQSGSAATSYCDRRNHALGIWEASCRLTGEGRMEHTKDPLPLFHQREVESARNASPSG